MLMYKLMYHFEYNTEMYSVKVYTEEKSMGISNHWNGIWNGMMERKTEWNSERTQL